MMEKYIIVRGIKSDKHQRRFSAGETVDSDTLSAVFSPETLTHWGQRGIIRQAEAEPKPKRKASKRVVSND